MHGAGGRSDRIAIVMTGNGRRAASNRDEAADDPKKDANDPDLAGKTQNKAASRSGHAANDRIKIASKPSRVGRTQSKAGNNPNRAGKDGDNEVGAVAGDAVVEVAAINGIIKVRSSVAGDIAAVASSRITIVGGSASGNRNATIDPSRKCKKRRPNRCRRVNRRSRRPLVCGIRFLDRRLSRQQRLSMSRWMRLDRRRICEMSLARRGADFPMRIRTIRCRCLMSRTKEIVLPNRKMLPMKRLGRIDRAAERVDVVGGAAVAGSRMIDHQKAARVDLHGSVMMSRVSRNLIRSLRTSSLMKS